MRTEEHLGALRSTEDQVMSTENSSICSSLVLSLARSAMGLGKVEGKDKKKGWLAETEDESKNVLCYI